MPDICKKKKQKKTTTTTKTTATKLAAKICIQRLKSTPKWGVWLSTEAWIISSFRNLRTIIAWNWNLCTMIAQNLNFCTMIACENFWHLMQVKLTRNFGAQIWTKRTKIGPKIRCFAIFASLVCKCFCKLHRIMAWSKIELEIRFLTIFLSLHRLHHDCRLRQCLAFSRVETSKKNNCGLN